VVEELGVGGLVGGTKLAELLFRKGDLATEVSLPERHRSALAEVSKGLDRSHLSS
jgi:hypothetical protein